MIGAVCLIGLGAREVLVDAADLDSISRHRWRLHRARITSGGDYVYVARRERGRTILLHREITAAPPGSHVDHVNGVRLDNRRANLRVGTHAENMRNRKMHVNNTSGHRGVSWSRSSLGWRAAIKVDGRTRVLGVYASKLEAAAAYQGARQRATGDPTSPRIACAPDAARRNRRSPTCSS